MDKLKNILILLPDAELIMSSILGTYKLFVDAKKLSRQKCTIDIAGSMEEKTFFDGVFSIKTNRKISKIERPDLLVIPALKTNPHEVIIRNEGVVETIRDFHNQGSHVASLCSGVYLLAASGILDGQRCTCHTAQSFDFKKTFPDVDFIENEIITESNKIYTSGGAFSFYNLIIYLIEKFYSMEIAHQLYKSYQIDYSRKSQASFTISQTYLSHNDESIKKAQLYIDQHYNEDLSISHIAHKMNLGKRTLSRRFKKYTNQTVKQYQLKVRIEMAKRMLLNTNKSISQIQFDVGFNDAKSFRSSFVSRTKTTPSAYRKQFSI